MMRLLKLIRRNWLLQIFPKKHEIQFNGFELDSSSHERPKPPFTPENSLYVIYTSGSTGKPKGCLISHKNVVRLMQNDRHDFNFDENDVWIMAHAYYFDFSVWEMYGALLYGGKLVIPTKSEVRDVSGLLDLVKKHQVSVLNQTPLAFNFFIQEELKESDHKLDQHLRYVVFGGDKLDPQKLAEWAEIYSPEKVQLINMFGITETTVHVTYHRITQDDIINKAVSPIGRPIPETTVYVLNDHQKPVPVGIVGEMYVGGTGVCKGYLNRKELTAERFIDNPVKPGERLYRTGDLARWMENGNLEYHGRKDFQVKIRGYRIELGEIESVLNTFSKITEAVIVPYLKEDQNELVAYFVSEEPLEVQELREFMLLDLPDFMLPSHFVPIDEIPLTTNGKLDKKSLPDPYKSGMGSGVEYAAPENAVQTIICAIWQDVLGISEVGINDNFFAIGGDSLKAIRVVVFLNKQLQSTVKVSHIFSFQTVALLANQLDAINAEESANDWQIGMDKLIELKTSFFQNNPEIISDQIDDVYPLTSIEKGMIFSSMLRPEEPVYYDQFVYNLQIHSTEAFEKAFELMVQKHPILRSKYYMQQFSDPLKIVEKSIDLPIDIEDISDLSTSDQSIRINDYLKKDGDTRMEFEDDVLWNLKAFLIQEKQFYVIWSVHHAILDGWSESSFVMEFANLAGNIDVLNINSIPPLQSSYKDYCAIQLGKELSGKSVDYWKSYLSGFTRNKLPFNLSGKKLSESKGMRRSGRYLGPLGNQLEDLKDELGVSYKAICLAGYAYLMHILCSETDVVSGVVSNDRPEIEDGDKILGCFLNTIPFRIDFESVKTYKELIEAFSTFLTEVKQHEIYLVDIAEASGEKASAGNPLFDCIFNFTDFHIMEDLTEENKNLNYASENVAALGIDQNNLMTNTLFDVEVDKTGGKLTVGIKYALAYFDKTDIQSALDLYSKILTAFVTDPNKALNASDLLDEEEKNALLYTFNDTLVPYSDQKLMHELFEEQVHKSPNNVALVQSGNTLSYSDLNIRANQLAHWLLYNNLQSGDNVGLIADRNFNMIIGLMAILKAGGAYVPVDPSYPTDRQKYILENSSASIVLMDSDYPLTNEAGFEIQSTNFSLLDLTNFSSSNPTCTKSAQELAYTIYTSGSTGRPKGVMIEHHSAVNLIEWVNKTFSVNENDRLLFITSMCFDLSVYDIFGMLAAGGKIVIATQDQVKDPEILQKLMVDEEITFWDSVPTTMNYLVDMIESSESAKNYQQTDLRLVFMSGDWIPVNLSSRIHQYFPNSKNISLGGATEGTVWSNFYPIESVKKDQISIPYGVPIDNNFFYILDDNQNPVPRGVAGELYIGGYGVAAGYANDEAKTNASFFNDPFAKIANARMYKTGDLGRMMSDGNMEFLGRKDFQVKIRGFRVELGEIENQLQKIDHVKRAVVIAKEDNNHSKFLCAYVVLEGDISNEILKSALQKELPDYMIPGIFIRINQVPITSNGKIDRNALPEPDEQQENRLSIPPKPGIESDLADIWKGILGLNQLGRDENVFELGAHSLHAGAFVSRTIKHLNYELSLRDLFVNPTIAQLAGIILSKGKKGLVSIDSIEKQPYYPLSNAQKRLWIIDQMQEGKSVEYNLPGVYEINGKLNVIALDQTMQAIVDRHESLRTSFVEIEGDGYQQIVDQLDLKITKVDLTDQAVEAQQQQVTEWIRKDATDAFDLEKGPLLRVTLLHLDSEKYVLLLCKHHIISDGWSMDVMSQEIFTLYKAFSLGKPNPINPLNINYKDFAAWQNKQIEQDNSELKSYWATKLKEGTTRLKLPYDFDRPEKLSNIGDRVSLMLNPERTKAIKALCTAHGSSTFMFLTAAIKSLLYRYCNQDEITMGTYVAGRSHPDLENQIGFFVNTLVLKDVLNGNQTFNEVFGNVQQTILEAFEHELYPYDQLVEDLKEERSLNQNPLFDTAIVMTNIDQNRESTEEVEEMADKIYVSSKVSNIVRSKFDLLFKVFEGNQIGITLEYNTELFERSSMEELSILLDKVILQIVENPELTMENLELTEEGDLKDENENSALSIESDLDFDF